eukprot:5772257-Prymnesium_polylepis.1
MQELVAICSQRRRELHASKVALEESRNAMLAASIEDTREQMRRIVTLTSDCTKQSESLAVAEESRHRLESQHEQQMSGLLAECALGHEPSPAPRSREGPTQ